MTMFSAVHHVALICTDYAVSRLFYAEILGLPVLNEVYREQRQSWKCDLQVGDVQLELFSFPDPAARPSWPEAAGLRHLAFAVADIDSAVAHLLAHGVACEPIRVDQHTGGRFTFFADPDGLPLELYERPQPD
ncbi:glyoxylase I family protein [Novosphingobium gossypii]